MKLIIRKATVEDAYNYTDCLISCLQTAYKGIASDEFLSNMLEERDRRAEKFIRNLENPALETFLAILEGDIIGFLTFHKSDGEIWALYLLEGFRRKAYGKEMLDFATNELKQIGHEQITLWVLEKNTDARRFYEKNGFMFDGTKRENDNYGNMLVQLRYSRNLYE